jgi:hypothetical protein
MSIWKQEEGARFPKQGRQQIVLINRVVVTQTAGKIKTVIKIISESLR